MVSKLSKSLFLLLLLCICGTTIYGFKYHRMQQPTTMEDDYKSAWIKVDSLLSKGLTQSALKQVKLIYAKAKTDNNASETVKSVIFRMKLMSKTFEPVEVIKNLQQEINISRFPEKAIFHSMLAEIYWNYYEEQRWEIQQRTKIDNDTSNDIATWDLRTLVEKTIAEYNSSLSNSNEFKSIPLKNFMAILEYDGKTMEQCPTLYDFLAHRAVDFFMNDESSLTHPAETFNLNDKNYFLPSSGFSTLNITSSDSLDFKFQALSLLQNVIKFHLNDENKTALIDADLKRLTLLKENSTLPNKDNLYLTALQNMKQGLGKNIVEAEINFKIAEFYFNGTSNDYFDEDKEEDLDQIPSSNTNKIKALEICENTMLNYPESMGAENCKALISLIKEKRLKMQGIGVNLPNKPFLSLVEFQNIDSLFVRVVPITKNEISNLYAIQRKDYTKDIEELIVSFYSQKKPVSVNEVKLDYKNDYNGHSVEIMVESLPPDDYIVMVSNTKSFTSTNGAIAYYGTTLSQLSYIHRRNTKQEVEEFYVMDRETGKPLKDALAQIWYSKYNSQSGENVPVKGEKYVTDENGYFAITKSKPNEGYNIEFEYDGNHLNTSNLLEQVGNTALYNSGNFQPSKPLTQTYFFTDRAIYRPGQMVYFKGVKILKYPSKTELITNEPATIKLFDANDQLVSKLSLSTNEYGTYHGSFVLPTSGNTGQFRISDGNGNVNFNVEEYKRPKFEITFPANKESYRLNDTISLLGSAKTLAGATVSGATVNYRVVREANFPVWTYHFWGFYPKSADATIIDGVTTTDDNGNFSVSFYALPDDKIEKDKNPEFTFTLYADVTDANGETRSQSTSATLAYSSIKVNFNIPELVNSSDKKDIKLTVTNLNGESQSTPAKILIYKLNNPDKAYRKKYWKTPDVFLMTEEKYHQIFPKEEYNDEMNYRKWKKSDKMLEKSFDSSDTKLINTKTFSSWQPGRYITEVSAIDRFGDTTKQVSYFTLFNETAKVQPFPTLGWIKPLEGLNEPGNDAAFLMFTSQHLYVLYELEQNGEILEKKWLKLNNEQQLLKIPILEKYRGNFSVNLAFITENRVFPFTQTVSVPYSNKDLKISFETFRDKLLPGEKETWKLKISGPKGEKVAAEMVATLYDASLDAFRSPSWGFQPFYSYTARLPWTSSKFGTEQASLFDRNLNTYLIFQDIIYPQLNWFSFFYYNRLTSAYYEYEAGGSVNTMTLKSSSFASAAKIEINDVEDDMALSSVDKSTQPVPELKVRTNFNETAFFYPDLTTDEKGNIFINFTIPEALTRWKMLGFALTKDLAYGFIQNTLVTQKELMISTFAPRFFREGDTLTFSAKVDNLTQSKLEGKAQLFLYDAITMKPIDSLLQKSNATKLFSVNAAQNEGINWELIIPSGIQAITYKVVAQAGNHSDGEQTTIPVLTNRMLVTETLPMNVRPGTTSSYTLKKLSNNTSKSLSNFNLTLEFTTNPVWYAVQSLPYLMEYPYECAEQVFSRYYANSVGSHIANSNPKIKNVFELWKTKQPDALTSNLEKNQELKSLLIEETPWVRESLNESERKRRIGVLFDVNRMELEKKQQLSKLASMQLPNGAWPWFVGMPENKYITQHIVAGLGHLKHLGVDTLDATSKKMVSNALNYLDHEMVKKYELLKKNEKSGDLKKYVLGYTDIHYLYVRSFFNSPKMDTRTKTAYEFFINQVGHKWADQNYYMQGMIALIMHRNKNNQIPLEIIKSLKENVIHSEELGNYWKTPKGFYWYQSSLETQALLIETFDEVAKDKEFVNEMKIWLLKNKQTNNWETTKATTEATYALLLQGNNWLFDNEIPEMTIGDKKINANELKDTPIEVGTGYFKTSWSRSEITPDMANVTIANPSKNNGISWGALYWQYFEDMDKITFAESPLNIHKKLFIKKHTERGPVLQSISENTTLKIGDEVVVRLELRSDRDMEYVHLKDGRASAFEPVNVLSSAKYQDGLWYYESTRDATTNFFISYLPAGTYVFEYSMRATHAGNFTNGIASIQCMYAPEFSGHSEGIRVKIVR